MQSVIKIKDSLKLLLIILMEVKTPEYLFHGWEVISTIITLFPTQEDCHDIHHFQ